MLASGVINFSEQWMRFVLKFCDRGRGLKPDWATKGIEFLQFSANPDFTKYITDQEFEVSFITSLSNLILMEN